MDEVKRKPAIRFTGFTDDWEQRKFSELAETRRGLTYSPDHIVENGIRVLRSSNINEDTFAYGKEDVFVDEKAVNIPYVKNGDILITSANGSSRLVGKHTIIKDLPIKSAVHGGFMLAASSEKPKFVNALMGAPWYSSFINLFVAGGNGAIGNLNKSDLDDQVVYVPNCKEQDAIGSFFDNLDNLITLHQRKYEKLLNLKKAMLEKMFPKNGAVNPEVRFAGFTDPWEQRRLGDHAEILTGGTPSTSIAGYWEPKEIPWTSSGEVNKRRLNSTDNMISKEGLENSNARWVKEHSVLIALAGQGKTRGTVAINNIPLTTNQSIAAIVPNLTLNYEFVFQNLLKRYDELRMVSSGDGTRGGLNKQIVSDINIPCPIEEEQKQIGGLFAILDNLITLHQRKLEKLRNLKKAFLEAMFV